MTRAVIYARVSSQAQRDRHTIASQLRTLPEYVASQGWELVRPADTYVDDGKSAKEGVLDERTGFMRLLRDAATGAFDVVVVVALDRLTRSGDMEERGRIYETFRRANVQLATPGQGLLDLRTFFGDMWSQLQAAFAAEERRKIAERTTAGKLEAIRQGRKPSGPTPYGLAYDKDTRIWSLDPERAPIVSEIYRRVALGESCEDIAIDLDVRGVPRARGGRWARERVWTIARATTYRGEWVADKARKLVVRVPRIVSDELWRAAQESLDSYGLRDRKRARHVYLCERRARCGVCGAWIAISSASYAGRRPAYYVCSRRLRARRGEPRCELPMRRVADVDARLWEAIRKLLDRPRHLEAVLARREAESGEAAHDWAADVRTYEAKLERLARVEGVVLERYRRGLISDAALDVELGAHKRERAMLERSLATARKAAEGAHLERERAAAVAGALDTLRRRLRGASPEVRRELVRALIPGRDEHVVTLGADEITAGVLVRAESAGADVSPAAQAGSSGEAPRNEPISLSLRVVA